MTVSDAEARKQREEAGRTNYIAYGEHVGWRTYNDLPMPGWDNLTGKIQAAWTAGAIKSVQSFIRDNNLAWCVVCEMYRTVTNNRCPTCGKSIGL